MRRRAGRRLFRTTRRRGRAALLTQRMWSALQASASGLELSARSLRRGMILGGAAIVLTSLGIVAFRTEILRARYELGDLVSEEARLRDERDALRVEVRRQAAFVATLATGTPAAALASGALTNLRLAIYGTLANRIMIDQPLRTRLLGLHLSSDETIALAAVAPADERAAVYWTSGLAFFAAWVTSTVTGAVVGGSIGDPAALGLDAAFPAVFVALLLPLLRADRVVQLAAVAAVGATLVATPLLPAGLPILAAALAGLAVALPRTADPDGAS